MDVAWVVLAFPVAYVVYCLLIDNQDGPFKSKTEVVMSDDGGYPVNIFDRVRRLFGVYRVEGGIWFINDDRASYFSCPYCLSFWVGLPFTITY